MDVFDQVLHLPYAYVLLPLLTFVAIAGSCCWALRPGYQAKAESADTETQAVNAPKPKEKLPPNQRAASRRQGNPLAVFVATPEGKKTPSTGSVLDRSLGGLRLAVFQEVEVGTVLSVRPVEAEKMVPWVDIRVRSCKVSQEMPGLFEVGCEYVKSPPYSIQLLFG
jgi:hypothetical protein